MCAVVQVVVFVCFICIVVFLFYSRHKACKEKEKKAIQLAQLINNAYEAQGRGRGADAGKAYLVQVMMDAHAQVKNGKDAMNARKM